MAVRELHFSCVFVLSNDQTWFDENDICTFCGATRDEHWTMAELVEYRAAEMVAEERERVANRRRAPNWRPTTDTVPEPAPLRQWSAAWWKAQRKTASR